MNTGFIILKTAFGSSALTAFRLRFSALVNVSFIPCTSALVKLLPPDGMLRCQIRRPFVTTRSVESTPTDTSAMEGIGWSGSVVARSGSWSNMAMLARAIGANCRTSTWMPACVRGVKALNTCSRFIANSATSASSTNPLSSIPPASRCHRQTTCSSGNGICCRASYLTMSGIFLASIGGSLMNFERPRLPGTDTATLSPFRSWRLMSCSRADWTSSMGSASGWVRIIGYSMYSHATASSFRGSVDTRHRSAFKAHLPISIPHT